VLGLGVLVAEQAVIATVVKATIASALNLL
jgi:hypothetical protein